MALATRWAVCFLLVTLTHPASAVTLGFSDLIEPNVSVTISGEPTARNICNLGGSGSVPESLLAGCTVILPNYLQNPVTQDYIAAFRLLEPINSDGPAGTVSDIVRFLALTANSPLNTFAAGPSDLIVRFDSDPLPPDSLSVAQYGQTDETGGFQPSPLPDNLPMLATGKTVIVQAASSPATFSWLPRCRPDFWLRSAGDDLDQQMTAIQLPDGVDSKGHFGLVTTDPD
jgi:hypothetical protein